MGKKVLFLMIGCRGRAAGCCFGLVGILGRGIVDLPFHLAARPVVPYAGTCEDFKHLCRRTGVGGYVGGILVRLVGKRWGGRWAWFDRAGVCGRVPDVCGSLRLGGWVSLVVSAEDRVWLGRGARCVGVWVGDGRCVCDLAKPLPRQAASMKGAWLLP